MTWQQFLDAMKEAGVQPHHEIDYIDIGYSQAEFMEIRLVVSKEDGSVRVRVS